MKKKGGERREEERVGKKREKRNNDWSREGEVSLSVVSLVDKMYHSAPTG